MTQLALYLPEAVFPRCVHPTKPEPQTLDEALRLVAHQWSSRLNRDIRVSGNPWHGYRIGDAS